MAYDEKLAERLREMLDGEPGLSEKKMFGGLAFFINGNIAVSASGQGGLLLRVDPERGEELAARPHAAPFEMRGQSMRGWLRIDPAGVAAEAELREWVASGVGYARSLPSKG